MALPSSQIINIEVLMKGTSSASSGGTAKNIENVFHFMRTTNTNPVDKGHIATAFNAGIGAAMIAALNVRYTQTGIWVRYIDDALDAYSVSPVSGVGAITGDSMPDYVSVVIQLKTALRGKSFRGSKHFSPCSESDSAGDVLTTGAVTNFTAIATEILAGFTDSDGNVWVSTVLSRKESTLTPNPTTIVNTPVTSVLLNKSTGTERRRKIRTVN